MLSRRLCCCSSSPSGVTCTPCNIPARNITLSITSTQVSHCFDVHNGGADCGPYITTGSETLVYNGVATWSSGSPEAFVCAGCVAPQNALTDILTCNSSVVTLSLFSGGGLLLVLTFASAASYTCDPFFATWNISSGNAYNLGLRTVTLS